MAYLGVHPDLLATAATDLVDIRTTVGSASAAAAARTTSLVAAAGDEVSAAIAALFSSFGLDFQGLAARATALHEAFAQTLAGAGLAYAQAEAGNAVMAGSMVSTLAGTTPTGVDPVALIMGGSGTPYPTSPYLGMVLRYVAFPYTSSQALYTPEGLYPLTGLGTLRLNESVSQGVGLLNTAIAQQIAAGNNVTVVGYSQSAIISSFEMRNLIAAGSPYQDQISFTLLGNPVNPNGGFLTRFPGLSMPSIGLDFYGATPSNSPYATNVITLQYDGYADFPRYPINFLSDLNAVAGILFVHGAYGSLDPSNLPGGFHLVQQPVSSSDVATNYYMITYPNLPLLDPLRLVPLIGTPLADLVQPDLAYLVNLGYGDGHYGYSTGYADVPTPFGLFPPINPVTFAGDMLTGAGQGAAAFVNDVTFGQFTHQLSPFLPESSLVLAPGAPGTPGTVPPAPITIPTASSISQGLAALQTMQAAPVTGVPVLTPLADVAAAALISVPQYDLELFAQGIQQLSAGDPMGLINAFGYPLAATTGLWTFLSLWVLGSIL